MEDENDELLGTIIKRKYQVEKLLGKGGMGRVYLVKNLKLGNYWAMKLIKKDKNKSMLYKREVEILERLNHPNIPHIIDKFSDKENLYIVETYVQGESLLEKIDSDEIITEEKVLNYFLQLCEILEYLHNNKPIPIVYRDLKPNNIIVTYNERLMLVDFGISELLQEKPKKSKKIITGSKYYSPPEQMNFDEETDERSDIYSLGMLMLRMLDNRVMSKGKYEILGEVSISQELKEILERCIYDDPKDRYQKIEDVLLDLKYLKDLNTINSYNGRKVVFVDGCNSSGKTFIASQLGKWYGKHKVSTCILNLEEGIGVSEYINVPQDENINEVIGEKRLEKIKKVAYKDGKFINVFKGKIVDLNQLIDLLDSLAKIYKVILIDGNIESEMYSKLQRFINYFLIVTTQSEPNAAENNKKIIDYIENDIDTDRVCIVINRYENSFNSKYETLKNINLIPKIFRKRIVYKNVLTVSNIDYKEILKFTKSKNSFFENNEKIMNEIDRIANVIYQMKVKGKFLQTGVFYLKKSFRLNSLLGGKEETDSKYKNIKVGIFL